MENCRDANAFTRTYLDSLLITPQYLDSVTPDLSMELYGRRFASPIMICAFSHLSGQHPGGMVEMARGAAMADICNFAGMGDTDELAGILSTGAGTVKIVKPYADREKVFSMLRWAEAHGALAVGMDIDHSFGHDGYPDVVCGLEMAPVSLAELKRFVQATRLPFVVKGVLSVQDAEKCAEAGVSGIVLSHHHGIMPYAVPPLMLLPKLREAVGDRMDLFVDCGMDTGADVFKALALGAKAVCLGRCVLPAFHEEGAKGVADYVNNMQNELRAMMARTCSPDTAHIARGVIWNTAGECVG